MVTYRVCFTHNRLYHPRRMTWEVMHDLPHHDRLHLAAARCDRCTAERPDVRTDDREQAAPPASPASLHGPRPTRPPGRK